MDYKKAYFELSDEVTSAVALLDVVAESLKGVQHKTAKENAAKKPKKEKDGK